MAQCHSGQTVKRARSTETVLRLLRPLIERALRFSSRRVGIVLVYHGVAEDADPVSTLVPPHPARLFEAQLEHLRKRYRVVPAEDLLEEVTRRRRGEPFPAAVTFDDDLVSHVDRALPILLRLGIHATFFLTGASLDAPFAFWWERLERAHAQGQVDLPALVGAPSGAGRDTIENLGRTIEELEPRDRAEVADRLGRHLGPDPDSAGLRAGGVHSLVEAGMAIGFHTLRHDSLPALPDDALESALTEGRGRLEDVSGAPLDLIAYPHGRADGRVADAALRAGYRYGFTGVAQGVSARSHPLLLGRVSPSYASTRRFALQLVRGLLRAQR